MRRVNLVVGRVDVNEGRFADLYRRYVEACFREGLEPMPLDALMTILKALAPRNDAISEDLPAVH